MIFSRTSQLKLLYFNMPANNPTSCFIDRLPHTRWALQLTATRVRESYVALRTKVTCAPTDKQIKTKEEEYFQTKDRPMSIIYYYIRLREQYKWIVFNLDVIT